MKKKLIGIPLVLIALFPWVGLEYQQGDCDYEPYWRPFLKKHPSLQVKFNPHAIRREMWAAKALDAPLSEKRLNEITRFCLGFFGVSGIPQCYNLMVDAKYDGMKFDATNPPEYYDTIK